MSRENLEYDLLQVKALLPKHYSITWGDNRKHPSDPITHEYFHCISETGIGGDGDKLDEVWKSIFAGFKEHFGKRFMEVYHETCHNHVNFFIYFRPRKKTLTP